MSAEEKAALVLGATGLVGGAVLNQLLDSSLFSPVATLLRRPSGRNHPRLLERVTDFSNLDAIDLPPLATVFCALGTTIKIAGSQEAFRRIDYELPLRLARWARVRGARHFLLVSSVGADPKSPNAYLRVKGELERDLAALDYPAVDIFQPSVLLGPRPGFRPAEWISKVALQAVPFLLVGPLRKYRAIRAQDVAAGMLAACQSPLPGLRRHQFDEILNLAARAK
jgi:uncharacterized protein YbjT (DUF2867 family)